MTAEEFGDCLIIYAKRLNSDNEPTIIAVAALRQYSPHSIAMQATIEIHPTCRPNELAPAWRRCIEYIDSRFNTSIN